MAEMPRNASNLQSIIAQLQAEGLDSFAPGGMTTLDMLGTSKQPYIPMSDVPGPGARGRNAGPGGRDKPAGGLPFELLPQEQTGVGPRGNPIMSPGIGLSGPEATPNLSGRNVPRAPIDIDNGLGFIPELPPASRLSEQELRDLQDGDRSVTPNQRYQTRPEARPDDLMADLTSDLSPDGGLAPESSPLPPTLSTRSFDPGSTARGETLAIPGQASRTTGRSGKPQGLAEDAEAAEEELNFLQRFMRDKLGMDTPEERQRAASALASFGATLASTPGNFLEGFSAATKAGMDTLTDEEQRALDNDQKRELMDLKREEAAASRANDALAQETARLKIAALKREAATKSNVWANMESDEGQMLGDIAQVGAALGVDTATQEGMDYVLGIFQQLGQVGKSSSGDILGALAGL